MNQTLNITSSGKKLVNIKQLNILEAENSGKYREKSNILHCD